MEKQSKVSGGKGLALAGSAVAAVLVLLGLVYSVRVAPPDNTTQEATVAPAPQPVPVPDATTAPATSAATAPESDPTPGAQTQDAARAEPEPEQVTDPATQDAAADDTEADTADAAQAPSPAPLAGAETTAENPTSTEPATSTEPTTAPAQDAAAATAQAPATTQPAADTTPSVATDPAPSTPTATIDPILPSFDTVRLAPDGEAVVAGRSMAGSTVEILLDGIVVGTAMTGGDGAFAAFLSLPDAETPRVLTLAITKDGTVVSSDQQVIIAPVQRPDVDVATATTDAASADPQPAEAAPATPSKAAGAPALLLSDTSGVRVLQPATPVDPARISGVALDVISYTSDGDVLLQGRATAASNVLIYLDNAPVTSALVGADGIWSTGLPGVRPGIYTLRLDEVDATGKVLSRIETPFKREDRDEVAAIAAASATVAATLPEAVQATSTGAQTETQATGPEGSASVTAAATVRAVTVQPGNTLWAIARESYGAGPLFVRVFEANRDRIRDPDLIYPGQIFEIPE